MTTTRRGAIACATAGMLALVLAACGDDADPTDPATDEATQTAAETGTTPADASTEDEETGGDLLATVETMFGTVEIPQPADGELTVVALGWSDAEVALALGVTPVAVYDWMSFGEEQHGVGEWAADLFGEETPTVIPNTGTSVDPELIDSFAPDLILNVRSANDEAEFERLSAIAPTVFGPEGAPAYATTWRDHTQMIADALGKSEEGATLITDVEGQIETLRAEHPEFDGLTAVTGSKFGDAYGANLPGDTRWDLLAELGFTLYGPVAELDPAGGFYAPVALEQVSVFEADVAVLFPIGYSLEELQSDQLIASLDVVREERVVFLPPDGELSESFSAASILSVPIAVEGIVPLLAQAAANAG